MATNWHVEWQDPHRDFGAGGRSTDVIDVHFVVDTEPGKGHRDHVTIETSRYTAEAVAALIEEKVARVQEVAGL